MHPQVILAGRRINDGMGAHVAHRTIKELVRAGVRIADARVALLGITFKENIHDIRNSRVPSIVQELQEYGVHVEVHDPWADAGEVLREYGIELVDAVVGPYDAVMLAVPHAGLAQTALELLEASGARVLIDVKAAIDRQHVVDGVTVWRL